ncbi:MAG: phosphonate ABC transporter ATP-binding protein [Bauldia sp.]|nr:phosphonate ABC transporter ATP-binding protein [Bauldia sp.]
MTAIAVRDLRKHFGRKEALRGVSLSIEPGEMVALIGASGSGKSTLIRHIGGLEHSDRTGSEVAVFERTMQASGRLARDARAIRRDVGIVFQQFNLVGRLSVLTNVLSGLLGRVPRMRGTLGFFSRAERRAAFDALGRVGIAETARQRASTLSGGQQQRAAIARTLVQGARLVLADEPVASLDPASAKRVMETLAEINRQDGITVLTSLHQVEYARRYCPRTIALRDGAVVYDGPSTSLTDRFLQELYGDDAGELIFADSHVERAVEPPRSALVSAGALASI